MAATWTAFGFFLLALWSTPATDGQRAARPGDFPWRFRLVVANESDPFEGILRFDIYFEPNATRHQTVIVEAESLEAGSVYSWLQKLNEGGMSSRLDRIDVSILTDNCTGGNQSLSLKELSLTSFHKRRAFRKVFAEDELFVLTPRCGNTSSSSWAAHSNGSRPTGGIADFVMTQSDDCYYHGEFYDSGQSFEIGCEMRCTCKEAMVDCDSMCKPPSTPLPRNCRMASIDRKCCDETECMEDALWDSCPVHTAARDKMPPWTVVLSISNGRNQSDDEEKRLCGASVIHKNLLITSAYCVRSGQRPTDPLDSPFTISVIPSSSNGSVLASVKSVHIHPAYTGKDATADLALIELSKDGLVFDDTLKRVNLPWPTLCKRYVTNGCAVQYTTVEEPDAFVGSVVPPSKCSLGATNPSEKLPDGKVNSDRSSNTTEPVFCVHRTTDGLGGVDSTTKPSKKACNQETGNAVVTKRAQYHYVVGVVAHDYLTKPSDSLSSKSQASLDEAPEARSRAAVRTKRTDHREAEPKSKSTDEEWRSCGRDYVPVTNLCPHIDWLKNTINAILARD